MPRHRKVCCTDNRTQYSDVPLGVLNPPFSRLSGESEELILILSAKKQSGSSRPS